jgi:hypothetical protein
MTDFEEEQKAKVANIEATVNSMSRPDSDLVTIEQSEKPSSPGLIEAGNNMDRVNLQHRIASRLESARKWIVVQGKDQPESKALERQAGSWHGNTYEVERIDPWESVIFNVFSPSSPPTNADWNRLVDAYTDGRFDSNPAVSQNFVRSFGVGRYEQLLRILEEKSKTRQRLIEESKQPKPKSAPIKPADQALHDFYSTIGFENFVLKCGHIASSRGPQVERVLTENAQAVYCLQCAKETDRAFIWGQVKERLKK